MAKGELMKDLLELVDEHLEGEDEKEKERIASALAHEARSYLYPSSWKLWNGQKERRRGTRIFNIYVDERGKQKRTYTYSSEIEPPEKNENKELLANVLPIFSILGGRYAYNLDSNEFDKIPGRKRPRMRKRIENAMEYITHSIDGDEKSKNIGEGLIEIYMKYHTRRYGRKRRKRDETTDCNKAVETIAEILGPNGRGYIGHDTQNMIKTCSPNPYERRGYEKVALHAMAIMLGREVHSGLGETSPGDAGEERFDMATQYLGYYRDMGKIEEDFYALMLMLLLSLKNGDEEWQNYVSLVAKRAEITRIDRNFVEKFYRLWKDMREIATEEMKNGYGLVMNYIDYKLSDGERQNPIYHIGFYNPDGHKLVVIEINSGRTIEIPLGKRWKAIGEGYVRLGAAKSRVDALIPATRHMKTPSIRVLKSDGEYVAEPDEYTWRGVNTLKYYTKRITSGLVYAMDRLMGVGERISDSLRHMPNRVYGKLKSLEIPSPHVS